MTDDRALDALLGRPRCRSCDGPLDAHQRATTQRCARPECAARAQRQRVEQAGVHIESRIEQRDGTRPDAHRRALPMLEALTERTGCGAAAVVTAVVPFNGRPLLPLPAERRREFARHLTDVTRAAFDDDFVIEAPTEEQEADRLFAEAADHPFVSACCAACQGDCCLLGKDSNAFLGPREMARHVERGEAEGRGEAEVVAAYLAHLPDVSTDDGCVYQGPVGCSLPRTMRSDVCNNYRCGGQHEVLRQLDERDEPARAVAVVALATWHHNPTQFRPGEPLSRSLTMDAAGEVAFHEDVSLPPVSDPG